ncbi:MAG: PAS domain-containing protein [Pseudomonadota bacterium]
MHKADNPTSDDLLALIQDAGQVGIFQWLVPTGTVSVSEKFLALHGPEDFDGRFESWLACLDRDDRHRIVRMIDAAFAQAKREIHVEFRMTTLPGGAPRWMEGRYRIFYDADGSPSRVAGVNIDITGLKQASAEPHPFADMFEESARGHLRAEGPIPDETSTLEILNRMGAAIAGELDLERLVQLVTDAGVELSGAKFGAFFYSILDSDGVGYMLYALSGASRSDFEKFDLPRPTAIFQPTLAGAGPVRSDDITKDPRYGKQAPHRGMPEGHLPVRSYLAVSVISRSGDVIGGLFFGHPDPDRFTERHERLVNGIAAQAAVSIDNSRLYQAVQKETAKLKELSIEREAALDRMKESEELYRFTVELNSLIPWTADPTGLVLNAGAEWFATTGFTLAETLGDGWSHALHPEDQMAVLPRWHALAKAGEELDIDYRLRQVDGTYRWCKARAAPRLGSDGAVLRYYGTIADINERREAGERLKKIQSELIHVSRLSAMDAMASTLAHELNQPLTSIANYLRGCVRMIASLEGDAVPDIVYGLTEADKSAVRAGKIMKSLREMATQGNLARKSEDLPDLIEQACGIALVDARTLGIRLRLDLASEARTVMVDRVQIQQVLINLLRNAVEALRTMPGSEIVVSTQPLSDRFCEVMVRDNGPGLAPEIKDRLFSAFNSTKTDGMGIGLSISRTIIESHGGDIWADSRTGEGTAFHLTLPITE